MCWRRFWSQAASRNFLLTHYFLGPVVTKFSAEIADSKSLGLVVAKVVWQRREWEAPRFLSLWLRSHLTNLRWLICQAFRNLFSVLFTPEWCPESSSGCDLMQVPSWSWWLEGRLAPNWLSFSQRFCALRFAWFDLKRTFLFSSILCRKFLQHFFCHSRNST